MKNAICRIMERHGAYIGTSEGTTEARDAVLNEIAALRQSQPGGDAVEGADRYDCGNLGWCRAEGRCTRHDDPPLTPPAGDDAVERAAMRVSVEVVGEGFDPFQEPETWEHFLKIAKAALSTLPDNERGKVLEEAIEIIRLWIDWGGVGANYDSGKYLEAKERAFRLLAEYGADELVNRQLSTPLGGV